MIMVIILLVYSVAEWKLRKELEEKGESVPNQLGKPTQKPTMKWIFLLFRGVSEVTIELGEKKRVTITKINELLGKILKLMDPYCEKYYT